MKPFRILLLGAIALVATCLIAPPAWAFCGFYVAKADTSLYNEASQVAIARDGDRTVLTMANDYRGEVADFALVVPVPTVIQADQVNVADPAMMSHLDAFSAPRLVEYFDADPCEQALYGSVAALEAEDQAASARPRRGDNASLGVTVEASFSVGEYDILILSAQESNGLEIWLRQNDYQIPPGASAVLQPYIRSGMKFFVAKVNLGEYTIGGRQQLRPLQIAYESPRFMLPIRLGMANASADQDLLIYLLTPNGRVELTNYRTVEVPSDEIIPVFVKDEFGDFYTSLFQRAYERENRNVGFLEYAWDMRGCDPCSADPLSYEELRQAGVFWISPETGNNVFVTRLHVRYSRDRFPEDLFFTETGSRQFFQGRYVMHHPFTKGANCIQRLSADYPEETNYIEEIYDPETLQYIQESHRDYVLRELPQRFEQESRNLARLTGWDLDTIRHRISAEVPQPTPSIWRIKYPPRS